MTSILIRYLLSFSWNKPYNVYFKMTLKYFICLMQGAGVCTHNYSA